MANRKETTADPTTDRTDETVDPATTADVTPAPEKTGADALAAHAARAVEPAVGPDLAARVAEAVRLALTDAASPQPVGEPAAVAWLRGALPTIADGYAAVLAALDGPPPEWLADVEVGAVALGCDAPEHARVRRLHAGFSETAERAADGCARALGALRQLAATAAAVRFLVESEPEPVPTWRYGRPRLGFVAAPTGVAVPVSVLRPGESAYQCAVTGRRFAAPTGAPVPCLYFDYLDADGEDPREPGGHPDDGNPTRLVLHPALAARGARAVLAALWGELRAGVADLAHEVERLVEEATLLAGLDPADVPDNEVPRALIEHEPDGEGGYTAVPAGWRDLGEK